MRIAIIVICAVLLASCGGGGKSAEEKKAEFAAAAEAAANMATLQLTDLPVGWSLKPEDEDSPEDEELVDELSACLKFSADNPATTGVKEVDGATYEGPSEEEVTAGISVFATAGAAQDAFNLVTADLSNCSDNIAAILRRAFIKGVTEAGGDPDRLDITGTHEDRNIPRLGDASRGVRITVQERLTTTTLYIEFQVIRDGRMGAFVTTSAVGTHTEGLDSMPRIVEAKLRAADATLPK